MKISCCADRDLDPRHTNCSCCKPGGKGVRAQGRHGCRLPQPTQALPESPRRPRCSQGFRSRSPSAAASSRFPLTSQSHRRRRNRPSRWCLSAPSSDPPQGRTVCQDLPARLSLTQLEWPQTQGAHHHH